MTKFNIRLLTFSRKLFLSVITLFVAFAACFMLFQYQREKSYKTELLNTQLQNYNEQLYSYMADAGSLDSLKNYIMTHMIPNLRVTIITPEGKVIFDSTDKNLDEFQNHSSRKEVQDALMYGSGYAINRFSDIIILFPFNKSASSTGIVSNRVEFRHDIGSTTNSSISYVP